MKSMTGFGSGEAPGPRGKIQAEVKSINHRFLDIRVRLPRVYQGFEPRLYQWLRERTERGRVEMSVQLVENSGQGSPLRITLNRCMAEGYIDMAKQLKEEYHVAGELDLKTLLGLHDVAQVRENIEVGEQDWYAIVEAAQAALQAMVEMQTSEGDAISRDLQDRLATIESRLSEIETVAKDLPGQFRERLERRISQILQIEGADPQRIAEEVALFADKIDITEEIVRVRSHLTQVRHAFSTCALLGKRLEFLVHEIHREATTMGAKGQDSRITYCVVDIKTELEKIREQAQNLH